MKYLLLLFTWLSCYTSSFGQTIETDRPNQTNSAKVVPHKSLQLETGLLYENFENPYFTNKQNFTLPTVSVRYGILSWLELRALSDLNIFDDRVTKVMANTTFQFGAKIQLYNRPKSKTKLAVLTQVQFPENGEFASLKNYSFIYQLLASHSFSKSVGVSSNVGWNFYPVSDEASLTYTFAVGVKLGKKTTLLLEPYGEYYNYSLSTLNFNAGIAYLINNQLQIDLYVGREFYEVKNFVGAGISWLFLPSKEISL